MQRHIMTPYGRPLLLGIWPRVFRILLMLLSGSLLIIGFILPSLASPVEGISLGSIRVVYPENEKNGTQFSLTNTSKNIFLMQSWVRLPQGEDKAPFIVLPPLKRLAENERLNLRILRTGGDLPADRESVFYLTMRAIPATSGQQENGGVALVLQNSVKLFYRPQSLPKEGVKTAANTLQFTRKGNQLTATNPSPFYLTLSNLAVGSFSLNKDQLSLMVPPKGSQSWQIPDSATGPVRWQLIDEMGELTAQQHQAQPL